MRPPVLYRLARARTPKLVCPVVSGCLVAIVPLLHLLEGTREGVSKGLGAGATVAQYLPLGHSFGLGRRR